MSPTPPPRRLLLAAPLVALAVGLAVGTAGLVGERADATETLVARSTVEWLDAFARAEIPAAPVNETSALLRDPHLEAVGLFTAQETPLDTVRFPGMPAWFSRTPGQITNPAPALGADGRAVLAEGGFTEAEIDALRASGALVLPEAS